MAANELLCQPADVLGAWPAYGLLPATEQTSLINTASQKILNFCRRSYFTQQSVIETLDGTNLSRVWLSQRPVITVATVTINGTALDNTYGDAWTFKPSTGELLRGDGEDDSRFVPWFPKGKQNVVVQYWAGFTTVPDPIIRATIWAVRWLHEQSKISGVFSAERIGDYSYNLNASAQSMTLPTHIAGLCADYVQDDGPI
jgi:hypothetical protein